MSTQLARTGVPMPRRTRNRNTMTFPRELRAAIPDLPTCMGRVLQLDSMKGQVSSSRLFGTRVHLKLVVKETGRLKGEFVVRVDLEAEAARALAATLQQLAEQVE